MANERPFLERYRAILESRGETTEGLKTVSERGDNLIADLARQDREEMLSHLPEFLRPRADGGVPTAGDILGVSKDASPSPAATAAPAPGALFLSDRASAADTKPTEAVESEPELPPETMDDVIAELDELVGLDDIKSSVKTLVNLLKIQDQRRAHDLPVVEIGLHQAYKGNPGTGKTTVARFIGRVYRASGRLTKGHLVETDRQGLVGGFVGQTAIKTQEKLEEARGGVLFIDEAYSLVPEGSDSDFGQEAITTVLKFMEDNRDDFVLIVAGYPVEMQRFLDSNPGLVSRFNDVIDFPDYSAEELFEIFSGMTEKSHYLLNKKVRDRVLEDFRWFIEHKNRNFANGRQARKYFEAIVENQANRLAKSDVNTKDKLARINISDLPSDLAKLI